MHTKTTLRIAVLAVLLSAEAAQADATFDVSFDTSSIFGATAQVVFQLIDGDGAVDNSALLSSFDFGSGTIAGAADYQGTTGVSGDLSSSISMDDSSGGAVFTQLLTFGSSLSFQLNVSDNFSGSGAPDAFSMGLYTPDFSACYSNDQVSCLLLELDLTGTALSPASSILNGASAQGLPTPVVTLAGTVPEPATSLLLLSGIAGLGLSRRILSQRNGRIASA